MAWRAVILWFAAAGVLAAVYLVLTARPGSSDGASGGMADPSAVVSLTLEDRSSDPSAPVSASADRARGLIPTSWTIAWNTPGGERVAWFGADSRVRAALRALSVASYPDRARADAEEDAGRELLITTADDTTRSIRFEAGALAGKTAAIVTSGRTERRAWAPASVADLARLDSFLAWRDERLAPRAGLGPTSVELRRGDQRVSLVSRASGWVVRNPVDASGNKPEIESLIASLNSVRASGWGWPASLAKDTDVFASPESVITLTTTRRRDAESEDTERLVQTIEIGPSSDPLGQSRLVRVSALLSGGAQEQKYGPLVGVVDVSDLAAWSLDASRYVSPRAVHHEASEVASITLDPVDGAPITIERDDAGAWASDGVPVSTAGSVAADALVRDWTAGDRAGVLVLGADSDLENPAGELVLARADGTELARFQLAWRTGGDDPDRPAGVTLRDGAILWVYLGEAGAQGAGWAQSIFVGATD